MKDSGALRTRATVVIAVIMVGTVLYLAEDIFAPMTLGVVLGVILSPVMSGLTRIGLPQGLSAMIVLVTSAILIAIFFFIGEPVVTRMVESVPRIETEMRGLIWEFRETIRGMEEMGDGMKEALGGETGGEEAESGPELPTVTDAIFLAPVILGQAMIFAGSLFFFLTSRLEIYEAASHRLSAVGEAGVIRRRLQNAERLVSRYFVTITIINLCLGLATTAAMLLLGMPMPFVWGLAATLLNYVLYVGPAVMATALLLGGLVVFDDARVLLPALAYITINLSEAQFVTPGLVGRHVRLNPLLVFAALVFGLWFWGPIGGIVAIPVLVIVLALTNDATPGS